MKKIKKQSIERFNHCQIAELESLKGGAAGKNTRTARNSTSEGLFDKDKNDECNCENTTR